MAIRYGVVADSYPNGIHWYITAWAYGDEGGMAFKEEISYRMTESEARKLNIMDDGDSYQPGADTFRFNLEKDGIKAAVDRLREKFGNNIEIELGEDWHVDNPIFKEEPSEQD